MILDHDELAEILERLAKKIGVDLESYVTIGELIKKVSNQNLCYQNENREIDLMNPTFKNAFFIKNAIVEIDEQDTRGVDMDLLSSIKMVNNRDVVFKDIDGKKITVPYDGDNIKININEPLPLDLYFKLINS